ncbi:MAG TPA: glycosidase [Chloroflexota bacterium]|nr:glycosidase [Chloroflexota bacterium]
MTMMSPTIAFTVERLGLLMAPEPGNPHEVEGVLNPAGITGPDGHYYLFPRCVGAGNYSRIGVARVLRDAQGRPSGVERLGIALEPTAPYEVIRAGEGGCEDPRVTYLACAGIYVMAYTALGPTGPRVALASSRDLRVWRRHGLVDFGTEQGADFNQYVNKDAMLLPGLVLGPDGTLALAMLHRPIYEIFRGPGERGVSAPLPSGAMDDRPSMWISYCAVADLGWLDDAAPARFTGHHLLARPEHAWEEHRIGGGTVPVLTEAGWLTLYHGVRLYPDGGRCYQAGVLLLDREDPRRVLARSQTPLFGPETAEERIGVVSNVVFPTAIDERAGGLDVYYGMADSRIGVVHLAPIAADASECAA